MFVNDRKINKKQKNPKKHKKPLSATRSKRKANLANSEIFVKRKGMVLYFDKYNHRPTKQGNVTLNKSQIRKKGIFN